MYIKTLLFSLGSIATITTPISTIIGVGTQVLQGPQLDIYILATKYEEFSFKPGILNYNQMKTTIGSVTTHQLGIEAPEAKDINVALRIISNDPINKLVNVIYMIYKQGLNDATGIITIYAKDYIDNPDFNDVMTIINKFEQIQTTTHGDLYPGSWAIGDELTASELGIKEPEKNGATIVYKIKSIDLKTGEVIVNAIVSKGDENKNIDLKINGFKTSDSQKDEDLNNVLEQIKEEVTTKEAISPTWEIGEKVTAEQLGIEPIKTTEEIEIEYEVKNINHQTGEVEIAIKIKTANEEIEKKTKVTGFQTKDQKDQKDLDQLMEKITDDTTTLNNEFPDLKIGDEVTREDLKIIPLDIDQGDIKTTYKVKALDPKTGTITLEVTGTIGNKTATKDISIKGFKSTDQINDEIIKQVKEILDQKYNDVTLQEDSIWKTKLPSEAMEELKDNLTDENLAELNIEKATEEETKQTTLAYKLKQFDDEKGEATIEIVISKEEISTVSIFTVKGFENQNQREQKLVEQAYQKILEDNKITEENNVVNLINKSNFTLRLPSKSRINVGSTLNPSQLRNLNIAPLINPQVEIHSKVTEVNDQVGTMTIVISVSKGEHKKELTIIVKGFLTKDQQDKKDVDGLKSYLEDLYKDVQIKIDSNDKNALPSEVKDELGIESLDNEALKRMNVTVPSAKVIKEAKITYMIVNTNDGSGRISIKVEIKQGNSSGEFQFDVKGFQTQNNRNQVDVEKALEKFQEDNADKTINETSELANKTPTEAGYKIGENLMGDKLNKLELSIDENDFSIEWEFKVKAIDDENGTITIEITVEKGYSLAKIDFMIWGFKKTVKS